MESDEEDFSNAYIVRHRSPFRLPLYSHHEKIRHDIQIKDSPLTFTDYWHNLRNFIWNRNTKQFCSRDGLQWAKIGCYYFSFFFALGVLSCALVIVYILLLDKKTPRRMLNESALGIDGGVNPGN